MQRIYTVIILYILCLFIIFMAKPAMMFNPDGSMKYFSYDKSDQSASLLNIEIVLFIIAIFCYFCVIVLELIL